MEVCLLQRPVFSSIETARGQNPRPREKLHDFTRTAICLTAIGLSMTARSAPPWRRIIRRGPVALGCRISPGGATTSSRADRAALVGEARQQFVIENKPGAGNNIATETVINAEPDGTRCCWSNPANYITHRFTPI